MKELIEAEDTIERTRWLEDIPKLPEWKTCRVGRKRGQSVSRSVSRSQAGKQMKLGSAHVRDEQGGSDNGQSCSLALIVAVPSIKAGDESINSRSSYKCPACLSVDLEKVSSEKPAQLVGVEDVNESFPVGIRLLPKKAKKAKKKKKSGRVLTHDEQVEGQCGSEPGSRDGIFLIFQMNSIICCTFEYVIQSKGEECKNTNDF